METAHFKQIRGRLEKTSFWHELTQTEGQKKSSLWGCTHPNIEKTDQQGAAHAVHAQRCATTDKGCPAVDGPAGHCPGLAVPAARSGFAMQPAPAEDVMFIHTI